MKFRSLKVGLFFPHFLLAAAGIVFLVFFWLKYPAGLNLKEYGDKMEIFIIFFVAPIVVAVGQITYYICIIVMYYSYTECVECGCVCCITEHRYNGSVTEGTEYKSGMERQQIGSIHRNDLFDSKVADVYGNVSTTYSRKVRHIKSDYFCQCINCGHSWGGTSSFTVKDSWQ